jgi:4-aminobutyrate aminotransferase
MPHPSLDSFFVNSGSRAIEAVLKMVRSITRKQNIITMQGVYHRWTFGAMAITKSKTIYADGFSPLMVCPLFIPPRMRQLFDVVGC